MMINLLQFNAKINNSSNNNVSFPNFKGSLKPLNTTKNLTSDVFEKRIDSLKTKLLEVRNSYLKQNPEAVMTLDHIKSNYDNSYVINSVENQTKDLQAVSTEDFCELSKIMKGIRLPESVTVYRAMEANDFNIGKLTPDEFFSEYFSEGKKVVVPIYMSTSLDENIAYRFAKKNPYRFIIKLNIPQDHPAVYMEELAPNDGEHYGYEEEINVIRNSEVVLKNLKKVINPLNNKEIYQIEGDITGFKDIAPKPKEEFVMDDEMLELLNAIKSGIGI